MSTRLILFTDIHANLPALEAIVQVVRSEKPDLVLHLGDAVDMGPHPAQVLTLFSQHPDWICLLGNHEEFLFGKCREGATDALELEHRAWTRAQLAPAHYDLIAGWQLQSILTVDGCRMSFQHYALQKPGNGNLSFLPYFEPAPDAMDKAFSGSVYDAVFFGHLHHPVYVESAVTRYYGLPSTGTGREAEAAYTIVDVRNGQVQVQHQSIHYCDDRLFADMESQKVPAREFLYRVFYGGRFTPVNENPAE